MQLAVTPISDAMTDPQLLGAALDDLESWSTWRVVLKAAFGEPLDAAERVIFAEVSGGREPPTQRVAELWIVAGRRGGKSRMAGMIASYIAAFTEPKLAKGETGSVMVLATATDQAKAVFNYALGFFEASPTMATSMVGDPTSDEIRLQGNVSISVAPANYRTVRGRTLLAAVFDEIAFWRDRSTSTNPDIEIYRATLPALATQHGMLVAISSPFRRTGLLFTKYRDCFGKNDPDVLVVQAPSTKLNPAMGGGYVDRLRGLDSEGAGSEYDADFRDDMSDFFTRVAVEACIEAGVHEREPDAFKSYVAFVDPSGGRRDSMVLAIAHKEGTTCFLDVIREIKPPFNPEAVVAEFANILGRYRLSEVKGDNYAADWVVSAFRAKGVFYSATDKNRSEIYLEALPAVNAHSFKLLDNEALTDQLCRLIRIPSRTGRDTVDHPPGGFDDVANAALGALVLATKETGARRITKEEREQQYREQLGRDFSPLGADPLEAF